LLPLGETSARQQGKGKRYALLVGVRDYDHRKLEPLKCTENDAEELAKVLRTGGYAEVTVLTSSRGAKDPGARPTAANIRACLKSILDKVTRNDLVLIALAGHGLQLGVQVGDKMQDESFFCPSDAQPRSGLDLKQAETTMIGLTALFKQLDESGAGVKLMLVDACRNDPFIGRSVDTDVVPRPPSGTAALFSCKSGERAFESDKLGKGHGIFFYYVIDGLKGKAKNKRGEVTWSSLTDHVVERVSLDVPRLIQAGARQTPQEIKNITGMAPVLMTPTKKGAPAKVVVPHVKGESRGYLGARFGLGKDGVYIYPVLAAPAELAGIASGDVLVEVNRQVVRQPIDVLRILESSSPGNQLTIRIRRGVVVRELTVVLGVLPFSPDCEPKVAEIARAVSALQGTMHGLSDWPFSVTIVLNREAEVEKVVNSGASGRVLNLTLQRAAATPRCLDLLKRLKHLQTLTVVTQETNENVLRDLAGLEIEELRALGSKLSDAGLSHVRSHPSLRALHVGGAFTDKGVAHLAGTTKLEKLSLTSGGITDAAIVHLQRLPNLKELTLRGKIGDAGVARLGGMSRLEQLTLGAPAITDKGLAPLGRLRHLRSLSLSSLSIGNAGLRHLSNLGALQALHLEGTSVTDQGLGALAGLPLTFLNLRGSRIRDNGLRHLKGCRTLQHLRLERTAVTDAGMVHLAEMKQLRELNVRNTKVTGKSLAQLSRLSNLLELDMAGAGPVREEDLTHFAGMTNLRKLTLSGPDITPAGLDQLKVLRSLCILYLVNPKLTLADFKKLQESIPGLYVLPPK
jgi:hypothetical protein